MTVRGAPVAVLRAAKFVAALCAIVGCGARTPLELLEPAPDVAVADAPADRIDAPSDAPTPDARDVAAPDAVEPPIDAPIPTDGCVDCTRRPSVSAGASHSCTVTPDGDMYCWGHNQFGQLGDGTTTTRAIARRVFPPERVFAISAGANFTCAIADDGLRSVLCWGTNNVGQLGVGPPLTQFAMPTRVPLPPSAATIATGDNHVCVALTTGRVFCWGNNDQGQLGSRPTPTFLFSALPLQIPGMAGALAVAAARNHSCALMRDGSVRCWGANSSLQLGDGTAAIRDGFVTVVDLIDARQIDAASNRTCVATRGGQVRCWGRDGLSLDTPRPVAIALGTTIAQVDVGLGHQCARTTTGRVLCWGDNTHGQLGDGTTSNRAAATASVVELPSPAVDVSAGIAHSCAYLRDTSVWCWGYNLTFATGAPAMTDQLRPWRVYGP